MQIVSSRDSLQEMSIPVFWENKYFKIFSADFFPFNLYQSRGKFNRQQIYHHENTPI